MKKRLPTMREIRAANPGFFSRSLSEFHKDGKWSKRGYLIENARGVVYFADPSDGLKLKCLCVPSFSSHRRTWRNPFPVNFDTGRIFE